MYCFELGFTPVNVMVTTDYKSSYGVTSPTAHPYATFNQASLANYCSAEADAMVIFRSESSAKPTASFFVSFM